jgi:hypothetical protein
MPLQKGTFFISDLTNNVGWTESWYFNQASTASALSSLGTLIGPRVALLMDTCQIIAARVVTVGPPRDSLFASTGIPANGTILHATYPAAGPWDCLLCRKDSTDGTYFNKIFMHGVPVGIFNGRYYQDSVAPGVAFQTSLTAYLTAAVAAGALVRKGPASAPVTANIAVLIPIRRTEHRLGRPFDELRGRRAVA